MMSAATRNPYRVPQGIVSDPFTPLYHQPDEEIVYSESVEELLSYAAILEDQIAGDFKLPQIIAEIKDNFLSFVRIGLLAYKVKVYKIYRKAYRSFKDFCQEAIGITTWQVNRMIEGARVVLELAQNGFSVLPKNEAQARPLTKFSGEELCANWQTVLDTTKEYKITGTSIAETLGMEVKSKSLRLPPDLYYEIQKKAIEAGVSIEEFLRMMFGSESQTQEVEEEKLQAWQQDLDTLVADQEIEEELKSEPIGTIYTSKSEPIGTVSTPKSEPIVTVSDSLVEQPLTEETPAEPDDVLASEPLTEESLEEALTQEDYLQDDEQQLTNTQTPVPHQNTGASATHLPSSSNQDSTSVLTERDPKASDSQSQASAKVRPQRKRYNLP